MYGRAGLVPEAVRKRVDCRVPPVGDPDDHEDLTHLVRYPVS